MIQDRMEQGDDIKVYKQLGKKVDWGSIKALKLMQVFCRLAKRLKKREFIFRGIDVEQSKGMNIEYF